MYIVLSDERTSMDAPKVIVGKYKTLLEAKRAANKWLDDTGYSASVYADENNAKCGIRTAT